jgi:hypothetical protein
MEQFKVSGEKLKETLKNIVKEGNVRRVVVRNADGRTLLDMPLAAGVAGALLMPFWTALAGIVMLAKEFTVVIERHGDSVVKHSD